MPNPETRIREKIVPCGCCAANSDRAVISRLRANDYRQRSLMGGALFLLLLALTIVLWHDRQFWFPEDQDAAASEPSERRNRPEQGERAAGSSATNSGQAGLPLAQRSKSAKTNSSKAAPLAGNSTVARSETQPVTVQANSDAGDDGPPGAIIGARTVLPPLEVEVVAGDKHRTMRPGSNAVHVDLQPETPSAAAAPVVSAPEESASAANVTSEAAERVQMSASTAENVAAPARPDYPMLARQMKVQGSVILQALIGKDGEIQNLHVVKGPHILAAAAKTRSASGTSSRTSKAAKRWRRRPRSRSTLRFQPTKLMILDSPFRLVLRDG